jgi:hypothetical protein
LKLRRRQLPACRHRSILRAVYIGGFTAPSRKPWSSSVERCLGLVHTATPYFPSHRGTTTRKAQLICARPITSSLQARVRDLRRHRRGRPRGLAQPPRRAPSPPSATATGLTSVRNEGCWYQSVKDAAREDCGPERRLPSHPALSSRGVAEGVSVFPVGRYAPALGAQRMPNQSGRHASLRFQPLQFDKGRRDHGLGGSRTNMRRSRACDARPSAG